MYFTQVFVYGWDLYSFIFLSTFFFFLKLLNNFSENNFIIRYILMIIYMLI